MGNILGPEKIEFVVDEKRCQSPPQRGWMAVVLYDYSGN
jgi:hypothetical protein